MVDVIVTVPVADVTVAVEVVLASEAPELPAAARAAVKG